MSVDTRAVFPSMANLALRCLAVAAAGAFLWASAAAAEDAAEEGPTDSGESVIVAQPAVGSGTLDDEAVGAPPSSSAPSASLTAAPDTVGTPAFDQPSFATTGSSISTGAVASSSLQATTAGNGISLGQ